MKILAIDTSAKIGSVAVINDNEAVAAIPYQVESSHAEVLVGKIADALNLSKLDISDIDGIAVAVGPGSFTGLRVGLASAKGLAIAGNKPLVGVSSLEALAFSARDVKTRDALLIPCINAYRDEVYTAVNNKKMLFPECSISPEFFCDKLKDIENDFLFIGDGAERYKDIFEQRLGKRFKIMPSGSLGPLAVSVGFIALPMFARGEIADLVSLVPNYIRRPDAEVKYGS
ncbi:MAG: tRNA (adenosine(37)-N6)-threonylcarbamoyltransferase complex dimerization subunit type 1 TsaB [Deltaproteobacteria bacterium RIFCSPLOWO2_02_FULL_47_10]|nr:MAG: tRNA (adenosine(37)-N6)-threonylcarbamoyltransferase complex dimerization subunit type 1 TsaB [Deltaproteobacteria bacterium RIFCSPLOWO2_02_FULL_47_10]